MKKQWWLAKEGKVIMYPSRGGPIATTMTKGVTVVVIGEGRSRCLLSPRRIHQLTATWRLTLLFAMLNEKGGGATSGLQKEEETKKNLTLEKAPTNTKYDGKRKGARGGTQEYV